MRGRTKLAAVAAAVLVGVSLLSEDEPPVTTASGSAGGSSPSPSAPAVEPTPAALEPSPSRGGASLLQDAGGGDGDSWRDTAGREYRLGLVNAPERDECFGSEATAERRRLTASGFRAQVYTDDRYGRGVSVVTTADGRNLNVHLARRGFADDRFLARFRDENPELARQLDTAFAQARAERAGLWGACRSGAPSRQPAPSQAAQPQPAQPPPAAAGCHPDYVPCVRVKGDGSGNGAANDLDCDDIGRRVQLRVRGVDPYRLDGGGDGVGCERFG